MNPSRMEKPQAGTHRHAHAHAHAHTHTHTHTHTHKLTHVQVYHCRHHFSTSAPLAASAATFRPFGT